MHGESTNQQPPHVGALWSEWGRQTRFLESARLAFARERSLWQSLEIDPVLQLRLSAPAGQGNYSVSLQDHLSAIGDEETLHASVLIHCYALAEDAAVAHLGLDARSCGGIEEWGEEFLKANGHKWSDVSGKKAGAVETAVLRNAFAHGSRVLDAQAVRRLRAVGLDLGAAGSLVALPYEDLRVLRDRLRSLLRLGGLDRRPGAKTVPDGQR